MGKLFKICDKESTGKKEEMKKKHSNETLQINSMWSHAFWSGIEYSTWNWLLLYEPKAFIAKIDWCERDEECEIN